MIAFLSNEFKKDLNEQTNGQRYTEVPPSRRQIKKKHKNKNEQNGNTRYTSMKRWGHYVLTSHYS